VIPARDADFDAWGDKAVLRKKKRLKKPLGIEGSGVKSFAARRGRLALKRGLCKRLKRGEANYMRILKRTKISKCAKDLHKLRRSSVWEKRGGRQVLLAKRGKSQKW